MGGPSGAAGTSEPDDGKAVDGGALRRAGRWLLSLADRRAGAAALVILAVVEATVFPGPTEAMLVALTLARPRRAWWFAALATGASVVGGIVGYHLGATLFDEVARPLLDSYDLLGQADVAQRLYRENALLALVTSGYTPIPYMLYTMTAGASGQPLLSFVVGSLVGRALKYAPIAALAYYFDPAVHRVLRRFGRVALTAVVAVMVLLMAGRCAGLLGTSG